MTVKSPPPSSLPCPIPPLHCTPLQILAYKTHSYMLQVHIQYRLPANVYPHPLHHAIIFIANFYILYMMRSCIRGHRVAAVHCYTVCHMYYRSLEVLLHNKAVEGVFIEVSLLCGSTNRLFCTFQFHCCTRYCY